MEVMKEVSLADFSSYKIGGRARYFFDAKTEDDIREAVSFAEEKKLPIFVLGGGTNLLIKDDGWDGVVVRVHVSGISKKGTEVTVGAGVLMSELLDFTIKESLSGLEWAGGLPGTVGGAIRGNAGCFGGETKDKVLTVTSFDTKTHRVMTRNRTECDFAYRSSVFKKEEGREIILTATFGLREGETRDIKVAVDEKITYRKERHPMEYPNIGSIFKNVDAALFPEEHLARVKHVIKNDPFPVIPAAYLISETGLKGVSFGGAMVSPKHPNFIVNVLEARASDVKELIELVREEVKNKFGVVLEQEVQNV